jgi:predicted RNA-binding protein YlqC (UPF0109 family)
MNMQELAREIVKELVDQPSGVDVQQTISDGGNTVVLTVRTSDGDMGKVIGKQGRNAQALRTILEAIAAKYKQRVVVEIAEREGRRR